MYPAAPQRAAVAKVTPKMAPGSARRPGAGGDDERGELVHEVFLLTLRFTVIYSITTVVEETFLISLASSPQINILKSTIQDMEKERDFYFGKLRNIELICQEKEGEGDPTLQRIVDILYATDVSSLQKLICVYYFTPVTFSSSVKLTESIIQNWS